MSKLATVTETDRLWLRRFSEADARGFFLLNQDPEVLRYTGDVAFQDVEEARRFLVGYDHYRHHGFGRWSLISKQTGRYLGFAGLRYSRETGEVDVGFRLMKDVWGQGLATEAAKASIELGFARYGLTKIIGRAMEQNKASWRVLEKIGMVQRGRFEEAGERWLRFEIYPEQML